MEKTLAQEKIKHALTQLISTKGLEAITVADIAREAKINRGTFYLHYVDKSDLICKLEQELIETLIQNVNQGAQQKKSHHLEPKEQLYFITQNTLGYIKKERKLLTALLSDNGDSAFFRTFKEAFISDSLREIDKQANLYVTLKEIPLDYAEEVLLSSMTAIVLLWLEKDCKEPIDEVMAMILKLPFFPKTSSQELADLLPTI